MGAFGCTLFSVFTGMENGQQSEVEALFIYFQSTCNGQEKAYLLQCHPVESQVILEMVARMTLTILYFKSMSTISQISNFQVLYISVEHAYIIQLTPVSKDHRKCDLSCYSVTHSK